MRFTEYDSGYVCAMKTTKTRGQVIQDLRKKKGLTQGRLARALGIENQSTISMWENDRGNITAENLLKLVEFFDVRPDVLGYEIPSTTGTLSDAPPEWFLVEQAKLHAKLDAILERCKISEVVHHNN